MTDEQRVTVVDDPFIKSTAEQAPFFCDVGLNRLAGERDDEAKMSALLEDERSLCLVYDLPKASSVCMIGDDLARIPLKDALAKGKPDSVTFLGMETRESGEVPLFAILSDTPAEGGQFVDVLRGCSSFALNRKTGALAGYGKSMIRQHSQSGALYCPCCGTKTESRAAGTKRHCTKCRNDLFSRTDPVAIVLVVHPTDPTRTLLVRKPMYNPRTRHTCVAGFIEPGESAEEGAMREVKEETNIDVDPTSVRYIASQPWPSPHGGQLMIAFMCRAREDTAPVKIDEEELDDAHWYTVDEVREALHHTEPTPDATFTVPQPHALAYTMLSRWVCQMDAGTLKW